MSLSDGHRGIISRIVGSASVNVVLPNGPGKGLPRYVVQEAGGTQRTATMAGLTDAVAEVVVLVETSSGAYSTQSNSLISELVDMFRPGVRFGGPTEMVIVEAPDVRPPLPDTGGVYSVPVIVRAHFNF